MDDDRKCARCPNIFGGDIGFVTCPRCRSYLPDHGLAGGCHHWEGASPDPRVTRQETTVDKSGHTLKVK